MKKILYVVAFATFALVSCHDKNAPENKKESNVFTFKASIEALATDANAGNRSAESASTGMAKATINSDNALVWATNDLIGIYFPDFGDKNQPFRLDPADDGKTEGSFAIATEANPSGASATVAYFPYQYSGTRTEKNYPNYPSSSQNNVFDKDDGNGPVMYFKMPDEYWSYDNEKMLTPLIASISSSSDDISFKHAGAAVKLTINNLAGGTYKVKMSVEDKQITGDFHINPANAGTDALALDAEENTALNHITLNTWKSSGAFSWIFPVPTLTAPELSFEIVDNNGITVWSKSPKFAQKNVGRAQLLVMPALDITPYEKFEQDDDEWTFHGTIGNSDWMDIPMMTDGNYCILSGFTFKNGDAFKIHNKKTDAWYPASNWEFNSTNAGAKDIIFNISNQNISVVNYKFPYPVPSFTPSVSITIDGDMSEWATITSLASTGTSRIRSWKFYSDEDNLYFYLVLKKIKMRTAYNLTVGFSWDTSGSYTGDNLSGLESVLVFQPFTNAAAGTPTCVNGTVNDATINGSGVDNAGIVVFGSDPNVGDTSDDADYQIEFSIPKSKIPSLPASGTIQIGAGYEWYNTSLQEVTL